MTFMKNTMILAAAIVVATGVASAQAQVMRVEIPFQFRAGGKLLAPGNYQVKLETSNAGFRTLRFDNLDTQQVAVASANTTTDPAARWTEKGDAVLAFDCNGAKCELSTAWTGDGPAYKFGPTKHTKDYLADMKPVEIHASASGAY